MRAISPLIFVLLVLVTTTTRADVVASPAQPANGSQSFALEELWRIGGDSDEEGEFFGVIGDLTLDAEGSVYLLDRQLSEIKVFDAEGMYLRTIGREGEGPGEFRRPSSVLVLPDGNVGVVQPRPGAIVMLTPMGDPVGNYPIASEQDGFRMVNDARYRGGSLVMLATEMQRTDTSFDRTSRLVRLDDRGVEVAKYMEKHDATSMANLVIREDGGNGYPWVLGPTGRVAMSRDREYQIEVYEVDGELAYTIERAWEPMMRDAQEIEEARERLSRNVRFRRRRGSSAPKYEVSDRARAVRWMEFDDQGNLWVINGQAAKASGNGSLATFDVFDPSGRFSRQVTFDGQGKFLDDRFVLRGDRLFVITQFFSAMDAWRGQGGDEELDDDADFIPMEVICYRLPADLWAMN